MPVIRGRGADQIDRAVFERTSHVADRFRAKALLLFDIVATAIGNRVIHINDYANFGPLIPQKLADMLSTATIDANNRNSQLGVR